MAAIPDRPILDGEGCVRLRDEFGTLVPLWPAGFGTQASDGEVSILDDKGRVVARIGDELGLGGGEAPRAEAIPSLDERTKRELCESAVAASTGSPALT